MNNPSFDLIDISKAVYKRRKFILVFVICSVIVGFIFGSLSKKLYTSKASFIVKSTTAMDRNHTFQRDFYQNNEYFASERDIDNIETIAKSDQILGHLTERFDLKSVYNLEDPSAVASRFKKRYKYTRNSTRNIDIEISDQDPELAQQMTIEATKEIENTYREYFNATKKDLIAAINLKIESTQETINQLNDTIGMIRTQYNLGNHLLPSRKNTMISTNNANLNANAMEGLELLQNYTSLKDQLLEDRDNYISLSNEYALGLQDSEISMFYMIEAPQVSLSPSFPKIPLILLISLLLGTGFAIILVIISEYTQKLSNANS